MAKKKIIRLIQAGLAAFAIMMALPACTDDHFDVREGGGTDANATQTIWEQIAARRNKDLSRFASIVEKTPYFKDETHKAYKDDAKTELYTFKDVLNGTQILTVFAPTDDAFTETEYQEYLTLLEGSIEDQYDVYLRLVGNHICRNRYTATGTGEEKLVMINGKKATFNRNEKTFKDIPLLVEDGEACYNIPAVNGVLHLINQQSPFAYNMYEYIKSHGNEFGMLKAWVISFDSIFFNSSASVENGSDANGNPIYVDSVYSRENLLYRFRDVQASDLKGKENEDWAFNIKSFHGNMEREDSLWALAAPTDAAWTKALEDNAKYYVYAPLYANKAYEDQQQTASKTERTIPKDVDKYGPMNTDSLQRISMNMDIASMLFFNARQQPRTPEHQGYWTAEDFQSTVLPKMLNTRNDTFTVEHPAVSDTKVLVFDNTTTPVEISNGMIYPVNNWNLFKAYGAKDVEVKVSYSSIYQPQLLTTSPSSRTFDNGTSKLVNDSLLGSISEDYFMTFESSTAQTYTFKLIDTKNNHQVLSGVEYEIGFVMVPDFYRWDTDSIRTASNAETIAVKKNKLRAQITYNTGTLTSKGAVSEKKGDQLNFTYDGAKVDTIWMDKTITFPASYKNITQSYPTMTLKSTASRNDVGEGKEYQHTFSIDRIILRAKE